jgi:hypothetical protein
VKAWKKSRKDFHHLLLHPSPYNLYVTDSTKKIRRVRQVATESTRRVRQPTSVPKKDPVDLPEVDEQFKGVIYTRKEINVEEEWNDIRNWLEDKPETIQGMRDAVRKSADMAARAKDLYDLTKIAHEKFRIKYRERVQLWRMQAIGWWEGVKKNQELHKQITEQMIEDRIIEAHADDYADLQERMSEMDTLKSSFKALIDTVIAKGVDNRKLLESEMRRPASTPSWMDGKTQK